MAAKAKRASTKEQELIQLLSELPPNEKARFRDLIELMRPAYLRKTASPQPAPSLACAHCQHGVCRACHLARQCVGCGQGSDTVI